MTDFTISPKEENVWLESWLDLSPAEQKEMDHVEPDEQTSSRFFHYQDSVYDIADFMRDDRFPEWHAGYPLNAFAMLMIRVTDSATPSTSDYFIERGGPPMLVAYLGANPASARLFCNLATASLIV